MTGDAAVGQVQAVVLAAGRGMRLLPLTSHLPKCLLEVGGKPIIEWTMARLHGAGIDEVVCVVGHESALLERRVEQLTARPHVTYVHNPDYARTNSIVSLWMSRHLWRPDILVINADVLFSARLLAELLAAPGRAVVVDTARRPELVDMAVELCDGVVRHIAKDIPRHRIGGEAVSLSRWDGLGTALFAEALDRLVRNGETDAWYQRAVSEVAGRVAVTPILARPGDWTEVDRPVDLATANLAFARGVAWGEW